MQAEWHVAWTGLLAMRPYNLIRDHFDEIATEWAAQARRQVPADKAMPPLVLLDHIPALLAELADWMESGGTDDARTFWEHAHHHAKDRLGRDFELGEVFHEYRVLRRVLLRRVLACRDAGHPVDLFRMEDAMDAAVAEAVERFTRDQQIELLAEANRARLALDAADTGVWDWYPKTGVLMWDPRCRALFGVGPTDRVDYDVFLSTVHPDDRRRVDEKVKEHLAGGESFHITFRSIGLVDRVERWIESRGKILSRDQEGRVVHFTGTLLDATERRLAEQEREQTAEFRERFIGIVSHDLRNPLSAIKMGATMMLRSEEIPPSVGKLAGRILVNAERMARMISDLLDLTRGRLGGGIPIATKPTDLPTIARTALDTLEAAYPDRQIVSESRGNLDGEWDPDRLGQVTGNLVTNALEHGDRTSPVRVELRDAGDDVAIEVQNTGAPIPPEELPHVFDAFRRGGGVGVSRGLGLGLFIACEIVRAHGGRIDVTSTKKDGTRFKVTLPRHPRPQPSSARR